MNPLERERILNLLVERKFKTSPLIFLLVEEPISKEYFENLCESTSLDDVVYKVLDLTYANSSYTTEFEEETIQNKIRSCLDIWRHVKYFYLEITIFDVMHSLYNIKEKLVSHYCGEVQRRVFKLKIHELGWEFLSLQTTDEFELIFDQWKDI